MDKCSRCQKYQPIVYVNQMQDGKNQHRGYCIKCAYELKVGGLEKYFEQTGINDDNIDSTAETMDRMMNRMQGQFSDEIRLMLENQFPNLAQPMSPEQFENQMKDITSYFNEQFGNLASSQFSNGLGDLNPAFKFMDAVAADQDFDDQEDDKDEYDEDEDAVIDIEALKKERPYVLSTSLEELERFSQGLIDLDSDDDEDEEAAALEFKDQKLIDDPEANGDAVTEVKANDPDAPVNPDIAKPKGQLPDSNRNKAKGKPKDKSKPKSDSKDKWPEEGLGLRDFIKNIQGVFLADEGAFKDLMPVARGADSEDEPEEPGNRQQKKKSKRKFLDQFGTNLNKRAAQGKIDKLIGRNEELERVIQILNRRNKNNPVLLGEPGVGKTAIAEGLAMRIISKQVPAKLLDMEVYLIDMTGMVAGTQFRGQFESRMKGVVDDASRDGNIILVIDELHNIMGAGDAEGAMNAANILKPALAKGQIRVLGSTTLNEYRRFIEKDSALERRFQQVLVEEPLPSETLEILKGVRNYYQEHHNVIYSDLVLETAVRFAGRYINERFFPDKAIDLIDEAGSKLNLNQKELARATILQAEIPSKESEIQAVEQLISEQAAGDPIELYEQKAKLTVELNSMKKELAELEPLLQPVEVSVEDLAAVVELWTGIPVKAITESETEKLLNLETHLHQQVIGQDEAIKALSKAVRRSRAGFGRLHKPASFIFVGPTGVGKTELVKALTRVLFDDEKALIRMDMSEFMEPHTVSKLIGSPPGYVGYDDGGQLTEKVRRHPYSVILLDEIEKAHPEVFNMLLQLLDDGRLTDSHGKVVSFENTVVIMTSNAGTSNSSNFGFSSDQKASQHQHIDKVLREMFRPEFLNRLDEIIVFNQLTKDELLQIVDLMLQELKANLQRFGISIELTAEVKQLLANRGYSPRYGARPLRKEIRRMLEDPIVDYYLQGQLEKAKTIKVCLHAGVDLETINSENTWVSNSRVEPEQWLDFLIS